MNVDDYGFDIKWKDLAGSDYVNTMFVGSTTFLDEMAADHVRVWYGVSGVYDKIHNGVQGWEDDFDDIWNGIKDSGYSSTLDEPSDMAAVKTITKYAKEHYNKLNKKNIYFLKYNMFCSDSIL